MGDSPKDQEAISASDEAEKPRLSSPNSRAAGTKRERDDNFGEIKKSTKPKKRTSSKHKKKRLDGQEPGIEDHDATEHDSAITQHTDTSTPNTSVNLTGSSSSASVSSKTSDELVIETGNSSPKSPNSRRKSPSKRVASKPKPRQEESPLPIPRKSLSYSDSGISDQDTPADEPGRSPSSAAGSLNLSEKKLHRRRMSRDGTFQPIGEVADEMESSASPSPSSGRALDPASQAISSSPRNSRAGTSSSEYLKSKNAILLNDILHDKHHRSLFKKFLVQQVCDESLDFWLKVEEFKHKVKILKAKSHGSVTTEDIIELGSPIYNTYLDLSAHRTINLPSKLNSKMKHIFKSPIQNIAVAVNENIFDEAQVLTFRLIETDPLPRYLSTTGPKTFQDLQNLWEMINEDEFASTAKFLSTSTSESKGWQLIGTKHNVTAHKREVTEFVEFHVSGPIHFPFALVESYIFDINSWNRWYRRNSFIVEMEEISALFSVYQIFNDSLKELPRQETKQETKQDSGDAVFVFGYRMVGDDLVVVFKSTDHPGAPINPKTHRIVFETAGMRLTPVSETKCELHIYIKAASPDLKAWKKEVGKYYQPFDQLEAEIESKQNSLTTGTSL